MSDDEERLLTKRSMANTSMVKKHLFWSGKAEKKQNFHDPDSDLMETDLSLTFQGDFCVSMIGRAALRSPLQKSGVKRCAA